MLLPAPRFGLGTICHDLPSQCKINVCSTSDCPISKVTYPTVQILLCETTSMASRTLDPFATFGLAIYFQLVPLYFSISVERLLPMTSRRIPTAQAIVALTLATAVKSFASNP